MLRVRTQPRFYLLLACRPFGSSCLPLLRSLPRSGQQCSPFTRQVRRDKRHGAILIVNKISADPDARGLTPSRPIVLRLDDAGRLESARIHLPAPTPIDHLPQERRPAHRRMKLGSCPETTTALYSGASASIRVVTLPPPLHTAVQRSPNRNSIRLASLHLHLLGNMQCQSEL